MPNTFLKATQIAQMTVGLLYRDLTVAGTVWTDAVNPGEFTGAFNDTVTMRVPARRTARTRTLRAGTAIVNDTSTEFGVDVKLDTDVYNGAPITDEDLSLSITDFGAQILQPQTRAVAEGLEDKIADTIEGATYQAGMTVDADNAEFDDDLNNTDWYKVFTRSRKLLNQKNVPPTQRFALVGTDVEEQILNSDRLVRFDNIGEEAPQALRNSVIGTLAGFVIVPSNSIDPGGAYAYHRTAFVMATRAPLVPRGVAFGTTQNLGGGGSTGYFNGVSARWIMDYDYTNTTDRSLVNSWVGTAVVKDPVTPSDPASTFVLNRAVKITNGS